MNQQQKSALKQLDRPRFLPDACEIADIAGVLSGVKPCALIFLMDLPAKRRREIGSILARLGLKTRIYDKRLMFVSKDDPILDEFERNWSARNPERVDKTLEHAIGKLLGYPPTATEHYIRRLVTLEKSGELPDMVEPPLKGPIKHFCWLVLSPDNYADEIEAYSRPLMEATKKFAPKTYAIISHNQRHLGLGGLLLSRLIILFRGVLSR